MNQTKQAGKRFPLKKLLWTGLLPVGIMVLGVVVLAGSSMLTGAFAITYFVLPLLLWAGCFLLQCSKLRIRWKILLTVAAAAVFLWLLLQMLMFGHYAHKYSLSGEAALKEYGAVALDMPALPMPSELGTPETTEYRYYLNSYGMFFESEAHTLVCSYTPEAYRQEVERVEEDCVLQRMGPTANFRGGETETTVDSYRFYLLSFDEESYLLYYPARVVLVGVNDQTCEVVWIFCNNDALDYMDSLSEYILEDCGWKYFR